MQRFKPTDAVFILPKFAHLYVGSCAVVIGVKADPFRDMFNEYTLEFPDRSTARLFEFQIIEDLPEGRTEFAAVTFDTQRDETTMHTRGQPAGRHVLFETPAFHVDLRIRTTKLRTGSILGQILERGTNNYQEDLEVRLMIEATPIGVTLSDSLGIFEFLNVPRGSLNLLVTIPQRSLRIFGTFSA